MDLSDLVPDRCSLPEKRVFESGLSQALDQAKVDLVSRFTSYQAAIIAGLTEEDDFIEVNASYVLHLNSPNTSPTMHRTKRELGVIVAAAAAVSVVGLVGANTYEIARIRNSARKLETQINSIRIKTSALIDSVNVINIILNELGSVVITNIQTEIRALARSMNCRSTMSDVKDQVLYRLLITNMRISDIINTLLQHTIIPEMLTPDTIRSKILSRHDMDNSLSG